MSLGGAAATPPRRGGPLGVRGGLAGGRGGAEAVWGSAEGRSCHSGGAADATAIGNSPAPGRLALVHSYGGGRRRVHASADASAARAKWPSPGSAPPLRERAAPKRRRRARGTKTHFVCAPRLLRYHWTAKQPTMVAPLTLICPPGAKPGQQLLFKDDDGQRFTTEVPKGVRPGMKFLAHRKALGTGYVGKDGVRFSKVASQSKLRARQPTPMPSAAPSQRSSRQPSGYGSRQPTSRGVGRNDPNRAKWDIDTHRTTYRAPSTQRSFPPDTPLGDQEWFEQFGFSGAVSEEKARDYGNGVPMWSPYFRNPKDYVKQPLSGLAPDAYWFEQYGFRGGKLSEDQIRIQGYGVPSWSPYYRTGGPKNVAESLASRAPSRLPTTREE